jgi:hypothetical protein
MRTPLSVITLLALSVPMTAQAQTAAEVAKSNNPLAPMSAVHLHEHFMPTLHPGCASTGPCTQARPMTSEQGERS